MTRIKICGITNLEDALFCCEAGCDGLGFVFVKESPRYIEPRQAAKIIASLPPFVTAIGLFANQEEEEVRRALKICPVDILQFHGEEAASYCQEWTKRVIKAFRIKDRKSLDLMPAYKVNAYLLDAYRKDVLGGTGKTFDWKLAVLAKRYGRIILAGGLTEENVGRAILRVRPYGVDVSSGVESMPGKKDRDKVKSFTEKVKRVDRELENEV